MASSTVTTGTTVNTTANEMVSDAEPTKNWMESSTPRIVFLSVFLTFGFFGNLFLMITVCQSKRFRSITFFIFIINMAVINVCECTLNMSILLASSIINEWKFGELACRMSSFFLNLISVETILGLAITTADRFVAVRFKDQYDHVVSTPRIAIFITFTWVQSFSFSVPVAVGSVPTSVNTYIVYCAISKGSSLVYNIFNALLCFILPLVLMIVFFVKIVRTGYKERFLIRNIISQHNYNDESTPEPRIKQELRHTNLTATICIAWLILDGPHVVTSYFNQYQGTSEIDEQTSEDLKYVWYVDLVLLWLRFSYTMALPVASFTWNKDLWKSFKDMILCRKNNSVVDESFKKNENDTVTLRLDKKIKEEKMREKEAIISAREQRVFQVPVLFATSHGVHIQTPSQADLTDGEKSETEKSKVSTSGTLRGKKCDVIGSRDNLNNMEDDTSDYDSGNELDPFSVSHPISVKQINKHLTGRKRSLSEPEVRETNEVRVKNEKNHNKSVGSTSEADSGLDLSTLTGFKSSKPKTLFRVPSDKLLLHNTHDQLQTEIIENNSIPKTDIPVNHHIVKNNDEYHSFPTENRNSNEEQPVQNNEDSKTKEGYGNNHNSAYNAPAKLAMGEQFISYSTESPVPKRRKKKRKDKGFDTQSITSLNSTSGIPPRPPPRLAPIVGQVRPGSSCSSQYSMADSNMDGRQSVLSCDSCSEMTKSDVTSVDNLSVSSLSMRRNKKGNKLKQNLLHEAFCNNVHSDNEYLRLDLKREIKSVPEEVLSPSDCNVETSISNEIYVQSDDKETLNKNSGKPSALHGICNTGYEQCSDDDSADMTHAQLNTRNSEARRKRREKALSARDRLTTNTLLNDGKGYQRLVQETP